jgi:hypothetical protein
MKFADQVLFSPSSSKLRQHQGFSWSRPRLDHHQSSCTLTVWSRRRWPRRFLGLDRHEPHGRPGHRLADSSRVRHIILLPTDVRIHKGWRDQPHLVTELRQHPAPMMGAATRLQPDQARRQFLEEGRQHRTPTDRQRSSTSLLRRRGHPQMTHRWLGLRASLVWTTSTLPPFAPKMTKPRV